MGKMGRAGRAQPHRAGLPCAACQPAGRQDGVVRNRYRRVLRSAHARALWRAGKPARADRFAARSRFRTRGHRCGGAQPPALRSCRWPAGGMERRAGARAAVPQRDLRGGRTALAARRAAASAGSGQRHSGAAGPAAGQWPPGSGGRRVLKGVGAQRAFQLQRWPHARADVGRDRRPCACRRGRAWWRGVLRRPDSGPLMGTRADHHGLRPQCRAADRREAAVPRGQTGAQRASVLHPRSAGGVGAARSR
ncbi:hypothetical protein G6F40_014385 [Rhizopus arrhizus]|nr:hypothetical protein G6F40_014385 [Rhizopus arrhizus]